jgi:hypothetical protein
VAIGDLHGDLENARAVLQEAGLADANGHWSGGAAIFVQTGDVVDRGSDGHAVIALLKGLVPEAAAAGGKAVLLLGNHEVMNMVGDWRYVSEADLAGYGGPAKRAAAWAPDGDEGKWLRGLDAVAIEGDAVFCHGGIKPEFAAMGVDGMNKAIHAAISEADGHRAAGPDGTPTPYKSPAPILGPDGPLWYRGYVLDPEETACPMLQDALSKLGVKRMVVGHTTRDDGKIEARCGGRLIVEDTGISAHYGTHHAEFEEKAGDGAALYPTGREDLPDPTP